MTYMFILKCALKLVLKNILYYDARSEKHQINIFLIVPLVVPLCGRRSGNGRGLLQCTSVLAPIITAPEIHSHIHSLPIDAM